jgi:hypothetical protein
MKPIAYWLAMVTCLNTTAWAGEEGFCQDAARDYTDWVLQTKRANAPRSTVRYVQARIMKDLPATYRPVLDLMNARAGVLLDKQRSEREVQAELFGLCMSQT